MGSWDAACTIVDCPFGSIGWPACECTMGYEGTIDFSDGAYTVTSTTGGSSDSCNVVPCPDFASKTQTGACTCNEGYDGSIMWDSGSYTEPCFPIQCPSGATSCTATSVTCPWGHKF